MPHFFFHVHDGVEPPDEDGLELKGAEEARIEAIRYASEAFADWAQENPLDGLWSMDVIDETGAMLLRLEFAIIQPGRKLGD